MLGTAAILLVFVMITMCGCSSAPESSPPSESMSPTPVPWGISLEQFHADLRIWDPERALAFADGIMNGKLYVDSIITEPVPYSLNNFDWNREETDSPSTFQLYLQSLGMVKFLSYAALEQNDASYLSQAALFIADWYQYAQDPARSSDNPKVWYDHGSAMRAENLLYFILVAEETGFADTPLREMIRNLLIDHAVFLSSEANYTANHNHGIYQDEALLYIAAALPNYNLSSQWALQAKNRLQEQLEYAFTDEFVHVENSSAYCVDVIELFSKISRFLQSIGDPYGEILNENTTAMVDFYTRMIMPNHCIAPTGDSFYAKASPNDEDFDNSFLQYVLSNGTDGAPPDAHSAYYPKSGYFISQNTFKKEHLQEATWVMFKAGYVSSTHKHADDLSILLSSKGHEIFIDPGMYNYMNGDSYRDYLISPRAHNTVNVDGQTYSTTVENSSKTGLLHHTRENGYAYVLGFNNMYPGVEIDRHFYSINDAIVLHDDIRSDAQHTYSQLFTLSEDMQVLSLTPQETVLKIAETDYTVRIRQYGSIPRINLLRNEKDDQGNLYGVASASLNEIHDVNTLKYDLTGTDVQFITVITIEDVNEHVTISADDKIKPNHIPSESIHYEEASNTVFLDQMPIVLSQRFTPDLSDVQWQLQNDKLYLQLPENRKHFEYKWSLLRKDTGELLHQTDWCKNSSAELSVPECAFLVKVSVRDDYGQLRSSVVGLWSDIHTNRAYTDSHSLNYSHSSDTITPLGKNAYQFTAGMDYALDYALRWYIYRNGSYYTVQTIHNSNTFSYTFDKPGTYTISYYIRTQIGDYEYWTLPSFTIG